MILLTLTAVLLSFVCHLNDSTQPLYFFDRALAVRGHIVKTSAVLRNALLMQIAQFIEDIGHHHFSTFHPMQTNKHPLTSAPLALLHIAWLFHIYPLGACSMNWVRSVCAPTTPRMGSREIRGCFESLSSTSRRSSLALVHGDGWSGCSSRWRGA